VGLLGRGMMHDFILLLPLLLLLLLLMLRLLLLMLRLLLLMMRLMLLMLRLLWLLWLSRRVSPLLNFTSSIRS
jgi:hypothetical protein